MARPRRDLVFGFPMSLRQALISGAVRFYSRRLNPNWRRRLSALALALWPKGARDTLPMHVKAPGWRVITGDTFIEPATGRLLRGARLIPQDPPWTAQGSGAPDLTARFGGKIIPREPTLVLFSGDDHGIGAFAAELLPRFLALDPLGVPQDMLLVVAYGMARRSFFQDAIRDGAFRPRPVEVSRPGSFIRAQEVHEIATPALDAGVATAIGALMARLYPATPREPAPVLLCEGGPARMARLRERLARTDLAGLAQGAIPLDPAAMRLPELIARLDAAPLVIAPDSGEAGALLLARPRARELVEIRLDAKANPRAKVVAALTGARYRPIG